MTAPATINHHPASTLAQPDPSTHATAPVTLLPQNWPRVAESFVTREEEYMVEKVGKATIAPRRATRLVRLKEAQHRIAGASFQDPSKSAAIWLLGEKPK